VLNWSKMCWVEAKSAELKQYVLNWSKCAELKLKALNWSKKELNWSKMCWIEAKCAELKLKALNWSKKELNWSKMCWIKAKSTEHLQEVLNWNLKVSHKFHKKPLLKQFNLTLYEKILIWSKILSTEQKAVIFLIQYDLTNDYRYEHLLYVMRIQFTPLLL